MKSVLPARRVASSRHIDDWLVTYADMITLLLCFFILFLSLSIAAVKKEEAAKRAQVQTAQTEMMIMPQEPALPSAARDEPEIAQTEIVLLPEMRVEERLAVPPAPAVEEKGDRLTTLEMDSAAFFDSGSARLNPAGREILRGVAEKIKSETYRDYQVAVEGHTDDTPIDTAQFPSNWELSTARAASVVRCFLEEGVSAQRLRAAGYADTFPKVPNRGAEGVPIPENRAQNRRVVIKLEKVEKGGDRP